MVNKPSLSQILFWLTPPLLAIALYGSTLTLPFFWDDVPHFQYLHDRPISQIWLNASSTPYYRPLTFTLWRLLQLTFGPTNTAPYHTLNLFIWIIDGWLVTLLARLLLTAERENADLTGWLAGLLFIVFPFASQSIPWVASLSHPLVTALTLGACISALQFARSRTLPWAATAVVCAALAPFASEAGIAAAALMALCIAVKHWQTLKNLTLRGLAGKNLTAKTRRTQSALKTSRPLRLCGEILVKVGRTKNLYRDHSSIFLVIGLSLLLNLAYLPIWAQIPKNRPEEGLRWVGWESVGQSLVFFLEGLTFPFQFLAQPLINLGLTDMVAVIGLGAAALAIALLALQDRRWFALGAGYCLIAALPAIISLPFAYIIVSPRLMVITAPAAAILWARVAVETAGRLKWEKARPLAAALLVAAAGIVPAWHIAHEVRLHHLALDHVWDFIQFTKAQPDEKILVVNATNWIAPVRATYPLGHEGVEVMPGYVTPQLLAWVHTQALPDVEAVTFPLVFSQPQEIYFSTWGETLDWNAMAEHARAADRIALIRYGDEQIEFAEAGRMLAARAAGEAVISFADRIWLTEMEAAFNRQTIELRLSWRVNAVSGEDIFANALDCNGEVLGLSGGASLGGIYPIWLWQPGESIHEVRRIPLDQLSASGCYRIELGLFNPSGGARTEAYTANGNRLENDVVIIELRTN